jgi:hypothetical protein
MKRLLRVGLSLYPRWWRDRYGAEFEALIEDSGLTWRDAADVVRGGVVMRITDRRTIPLHAALIGATLGAAIYLLTPDVYESAAMLRLTLLCHLLRGGFRWKLAMRFNSLRLVTT